MKIRSKKNIKTATENVEENHDNLESEIDISTDTSSDSKESSSFNVKYTLDFENAIRFVDDVVDICVDEETGEYKPELLDYMVKLSAIKYYSDYEMPSDVRESYDLIYKTDISEKVIQNINTEQFNNLVNAARSKIEFKANYIINTVANKVAELIKKFDDLFEEGNKFMSGLNEDDISGILNFTKNIKEINEDQLAVKMYENMSSKSEND